MQISNLVHDFDLRSHITMPDMTLLDLVSYVAASAMIFGGVVPFIPQYLDIRRIHNADGFSPFVCLTLLIANILRVMFWFGKHFELPLLAQSVIMIFAMLAMVHLCVRTKQRAELVSSRHHHFLEFDLDYFWRWSDFLSYVEFLVSFATLVGMATILFLNNRIYVEIIGFLAVFAEAMLGAPQFYRNFQNKSTIGMSRKMVGFWTMGDIFKTVYFILREAPAQFWICGMLQVSIDISILLQVYFYRTLQTITLPKLARS